jgi:hypothetical protein
MSVSWPFALHAETVGSLVRAGRRLDAIRAFHIGALHP